MANTNQSSSSTAETVAGYAEEASERLGKFGRDAESAAEGLVDRGREAGERVQEVAGNFRSAVDKSVREQPIATLAIATVLGFVLGAVWKS
jgi:ElaB/YqjD/DUF883 family membrane-anchored ribosome-binding protein